MSEAMQTARGNFEQQAVLAVDIGGTKLAAALVDPQGTVLASRQEPVCQEGPQAGIIQIVHMLETLLTASGTGREQVAAIGVGIPAVLENDSDRVVWAPNLNGWRQVDLRPALEVYFGLPTCLEYDGHTAVLGEWWLGAGRGLHSLVDIIIGTGVGGGLILEGHLIRGVSRLAGAAGWSVLAESCPAEASAERSLGFWEARIAGPGLARRAQSLLKAGGGGKLARLAQPPDAAQIYAAAQQGDPLALQIAHEQADLLGVGLANIVSLLNPQRIILGGSVGAACGFLLPRIQAALQHCAQPISARAVEVAVSPLGSQAGLLGAAYAARLRFGPS